MASIAAVETFTALDAFAAILATYIGSTHIRNDCSSFKAGGNYGEFSKDNLMCIDIDPRHAVHVQASLGEGE